MPTGKVASGTDPRGGFSGLFVWIPPARHQKNPMDRLVWNQRSLDHASAVHDDRVREFYPSLYLNMGKAHEDLGNRAAAKRFYGMAAKVLSLLSEGRYDNVVRDAVERALRRLL